MLQLTIQYEIICVYAYWFMVTAKVVWPQSLVDYFPQSLMQLSFPCQTEGNTEQCTTHLHKPSCVCRSHLLVIHIVPLVVLVMDGRHLNNLSPCSVCTLVVIHIFYCSSIIWYEIIWNDPFWKGSSRTNDGWIEKRIPFWIMNHLIPHQIFLFWGVEWVWVGGCSPGLSKVNVIPPLRGPYRPYILHWCFRSFNSIQ